MIEASRRLSRVTQKLLVPTQKLLEANQESRNRKLTETEWQSLSWSWKSCDHSRIWNGESIGLVWQPVSTKVLAKALTVNKYQRCIMKSVWCFTMLRDSPQFSKLLDNARCSVILDTRWYSKETRQHLITTSSAPNAQSGCLKIEHEDGRESSRV